MGVGSPDKGHGRERIIIKKNFCLGTLNCCTADSGVQTFFLNIKNPPLHM